MEIQGGESREELGGRIRTQKPKKTCGFYMFFAKHIVFLQVFQCFCLENVVFSMVFQCFWKGSNPDGGGGDGGGALITSELSSPEGFVRELISN